MYLLSISEANIAYFVAYGKLLQLLGIGFADRCEASEWVEMQTVEANAADRALICFH